ncbi:hypothetical protein [Ruminococcus sp.]|uniref:hypothetical protein n=1 Tax=Ruminococcus sp. TaxID=41978 RepID=UPI0025E7C2D2|nr:hypothetical protein [Ruminococcus sp.]
MTNIKRRISAFVAAFAMMGAVIVPATAKYMINESATEVSAEYIPFGNYSINYRADVKANTKFRESPSKNSKVVASVKKRTYGKKVHFERVVYYNFYKDSEYSYLNGTWYYSKYDKGWVNSNDIITS